MISLNAQQKYSSCTIHVLDHLTRSSHLSYVTQDHQNNKTETFLGMKAVSKLYDLSEIKIGHVDDVSIKSNFF